MKHFGWAETKLIPEVLFFQEGPGVRKWQFRESGVKLLNGRNINDNALDLSTTSVYLSEDEANGKYSHFLAEEGDFVIACSGITIEKFGKKSAFVRKEHLPLCMNTSTMRFKSLNENVLDIRFFNYYIRSNAFLSQLQRLITGSAQLNFGPSHVKKIAIPLPPMEEQKRIAGILDEADQVRKKTQALIDKYDELAQSLFLDMFGDPVTNPKGWEWSTLGELMENRDSQRVPVKSSDRDSMHGEFPYYGASGIIDYVNDFTHEGEALLIGEDGANLLARTSPIAFRAKGKYWVNNHAHVLSYNGKAIPLFMEYLINQLDISQYVTGSAQPKLNRKNMDRIPLYHPPKYVQQDFFLQLTEVEKSQARLTESLDKANENFNALLQKAFKGELT